MKRHHTIYGQSSFVGLNGSRSSSIFWKAIDVLRRVGLNRIRRQKRLVWVRFIIYMHEAIYIFLVFFGFSKSSMTKAYPCDSGARPGKAGNRSSFFFVPWQSLMLEITFSTHYSLGPSAFSPQLSAAQDCPQHSYRASPRVIAPYTKFYIANIVPLRRSSL